MTDTLPMDHPAKEVKDMLRMWTALQSRIVRDDEGASLVEYALLVALIAVIAIGAVTLVGNNVSGELNSVGNAISTP